MKIVLPGGSGQVGTLVARAFAAEGHEVVVLGRNPGGRAPSTATPWRTVGWEARTVGDWAREIDGADVVLNLAGRSVNCRYTPENRASGDGRQFVSWIHGDDFLAALRFLIDHEEIDGAVNLTSPNSLPNANFIRALREAWGIRVGLPREPVDAGDRGAFPEDGDRADPEESASGAGATVGGGVCVSISGVAGGGGGFVWAMAGGLKVNR